MNKDQAVKLERVTITIPEKLIADIEVILSKGAFDRLLAH